MDGRAIQERIKTIRIAIAAIQDSEAVYRRTTAHSDVQKNARDARREALEQIKEELASLLNPKSQ
jgi:hypothetical protein